MSNLESLDHILVTDDSHSVLSTEINNLEDKTSSDTHSIHSSLWLLNCAFLMENITIGIIGRGVGKKLISWIFSKNLLWSTVLKTGMFKFLQACIMYQSQTSSFTICLYPVASDRFPRCYFWINQEFIVVLFFKTCSTCVLPVFHNAWQIFGSEFNGCSSLVEMKPATLAARSRLRAAGWNV